MPTLPPGIEHLGWLLGVWSGTGRGGYPSVDDFQYAEESTFACDLRPRVSYSQRTWLPDGSPSHVETGYLRPGAAAGSVEAVIAQAVGVVEVATGTVAGARLELTSSAVSRTPTAKDVRALRRVLELDDAGMLHVRVDMEAVGHPMAFHLAAELRRVER